MINTESSINLKLYIPENKYKVGQRVINNEGRDEDDEEITKKDVVCEIIAHAFVFFDSVSALNVIQQKSTDQGYDCSGLGVHVYELEWVECQGSFVRIEEHYFTQKIQSNIFEMIASNENCAKYPDLQLGAVHKKYMDFSPEDREGSSYFGEIEDNFQLITGFQTGSGCIGARGYERTSLINDTLSPTVALLFSSGTIFAESLATILHEDMYSDTFDGNASYEDATADPNAIVWASPLEFGKKEISRTKVDLDAIGISYSEVRKETQVDLIISNPSDRECGKFKWPGISLRWKEKEET